MSNDARLSTGLPGHPKTKKLLRRLGPAAGWGLVCLILWARDNRPDGDLSGMTSEDIELAIDWSGENDAFVAALVSVGFLEGPEDGYRLHDWEDHQPWATGSEARSEKARWASLIRRHGREEAARLMPAYSARLSSTSKEIPASSNNCSATSTGLAEDSPASRKKTSAPSPNPSPNPSPRSKEPPISPAVAGDLLGDKPKRKSDRITFPTFVESCRELGVKPIPADDKIFQYAEDTQIPREFIALVWRWFSAKHREGRKQQSGIVGWRAHFRDAVRANWAKAWYFPGEGQDAQLTTVGVALKREAEAAAERRSANPSEAHP